MRGRQRRLVIATAAIALWFAGGAGTAQGTPYDPWAQAARYRVELVIDRTAAGSPST